MSKIFSRIKLTCLFTNRYLSLAQLVLIQRLLMSRPSWNKVVIKLYQRCFNVVSTSHTDVVSTLCNTENPTFWLCFIFNFGSTLFQRWSTTLKQRWSDVEVLARYCVLEWNWRSSSTMVGACVKNKILKFRVTKLSEKWTFQLF